MEQNEQIEHCQTPKMGYNAAHSDADRRLAEGQRQVFCTRCERWQWPDELCELAKAEKR